MNSHKLAIDIMHPNVALVKAFWSSVCSDIAPALLAITESHKDLYDILEVNKFKNCHVFNFDAHHDLGYDKRKVIDCGNWAGKALDKGLIKEYTLFYPTWRQADLEEFPKHIDYHICLPEPRLYPIVHICRSSCWTPSWADHHWLWFIGHWKKHQQVWDRKVSAPFVLRKRKPNLTQARKLAADYQQQLKRLLTDNDPENMEKFIKAHG